MLYANLEQTTFIAFELANSVMIVHEFLWLGNCIVARIFYFITRAKIYIAPNLNFQEDSSNLSSYYLVNFVIVFSVCSPLPNFIFPVGPTQWDNQGEYLQKRLVNPYIE